MKFSLRIRRTLLIATAMIAACYWLVRPTIKAELFAREVRAQNYPLADSYFRDPQDSFLVAWNDKHWRLKTYAELEEWSFGELVCGERKVRLGVAYGDAGPMRTSNWIVTATRSGLLTPVPTWGGGSVGGGYDVPLTPQAPTT